MSSSKKLPTTTCLGSAIVPVKINSEFQGGCGSGEASIVVFLEPSRSSRSGSTVDSTDENNDDSSHIIRIQLLALVSSSSHHNDGDTHHSDQSTLYECDIPASKLQSVWSKSSGNHNTFQLLSNLTRDLFLRGKHNDHSTTVAAGNQHHVHNSQSQNDDTMNVNVSYELQQQQQQVDHANNANTSLSLIIRQAVVHGSMMRIVYQTTMKQQQQQLHDNNNATIHHCRILGRLLNESIRRQELLEGNVQVWKRSLEEHSQAEELSKATLLRNFVKLRNTLVQKHQDEVNELKATHAMEKKEWQQRQQQSGSLKKRKRNPVDDKDEEEGDIDAATKDDDNDDDGDDDDRMEQGGKTLFDDRLVTRLANNTGPEINEYRERTLQPDAMVDFVQVQADVKKAKEEQQHILEKERKKKPPP
ncbi:hypothetical protein IV203_024113 [Nitzschia inconspicua]|uniref:Uncharacterized protein n=1 Tax=Nitzschia inconspicua TaxID=303405 RepID=A0A9K3PB70_9STRA|nr:hypothetical protein IV203_024113 [Nitzschia inconspicua]